jgi:DNA-binding MarR family transcriptional regulator
MKAQMHPASLESHMGYWLRMVSNHVSQSFARKVEGSGVTMAEWVMLREMYEAGETSPSRLAASSGLTRGAVSKLVDRLVRKKLATRAEADEDRRYQDVKLTAAGKSLVPALAALADKNDEEFFSCLTARERATLTAMLRKLASANNLKKLPVN